MMSAKKSTLVPLQVVLIAFFVKFTSSQDVLFNLNPKKVVAVTSDKFLSLTLDPVVLLTGDVLTSSTEASTNMAKALAPGYVRLAGPRSNSYKFERSLFPQSGYEDPDLMFSEAHWVLVQQWAQRAGLDVVSTLNPQRIENEDQATNWDPRNSLELISFSDHMGYNISWQLGYECQTRCDISGIDLGKDVARLRNMLGAFPRYSNSIIAGPDVVSFRGKQQQQFIQDYLNSAGNSLSVITWHPDFAGIALDSDGVALQIDTLSADRDLLYKSMGRSVAKKPLWIAESKPEECKRQFLGALVWARRLGNAAKLGVQVIMRQPDASNIVKPTPDYWVSLLHKMLVGKEVLDTKLTSGNKTHVHFYCQCTKPSAKYERGAVTIFGINLTPGRVSVGLKGLKIKAVHKYILMPGYDTDNRMFAETVLLNNEPLTLLDGKSLPEINPAVTLMGKNMAVKLPSGGIGFWVIPGARVKSCLGHDEEGGDKNLLLKKLTKKLEEPEVGDENLGHELEDDNHNQDFDAESVEDIKSLLKSKKKKRKYWHSDETEDEERRFKRIDTKKEFEKLEKLLKRNNNNDEKRGSHFKGKVGLAMFESGANESEENKGENISDEDEGLVRFKKNEKPNSGEEIRTKLEEYKNKLIQYEARKKNNEKKTSKPRDEHSLNDVDTQKAVEALALITEFGKSSEKMKYEADPRSSKSSNLATDIGEEMMIEELEKSDKIKRMIDPKSIDKIYQFLVNNNRDKLEKRSVENLDKNLRDKRDLEKLLGDDPLGLRKEGLFKKRIKNDEVKERRFERRNRKKDKEEIGLKKELAVARYDPRITDSNENNFFGFPEMKPLENFPEGDVFLAEGSSSEEKSHDYDYVKDDDDDEAATGQQKRKKNRKPKNKIQNQNIQDETWIEEPNSNLLQAPNEFFERTNLPKVVIKTQWKDHGELYEPESLQPGNFKEEQKTNENETDSVIVRDNRPDEREDKKAKETAVKKLMNYYDNSEILSHDNADFGREKKKPKSLTNRPQSRPETSTKRKVKESLKAKPAEITKEENAERVLEVDNEYEDSADPGSLEFVNSKAEEDYSEEIYEDKEIGVKKRPKRKIANLDIDIFRQEMIREDAGNLKDCKCRVIRSNGKLKCKNCKRNNRRQRDIADNIGSQELILDSTPSTTNDQTFIRKETTTEENLKNEAEIPEVNQDQRTIETSLPNDEKLMQKHAEADDPNGNEKQDKDSSSEINVEVGLVPESSSPLIDNADSQIIGSKKAGSDSNTDLRMITDNTEGKTETDKSIDDVVGSRRLIDDVKEDGVANKESGESSFDKKTVDENTETADIEKNISTDDIIEDNHAKRHVSEVPDANPKTQSSKKLSLSKGMGLGSSLRTETSESKLKNGVDFKLKSTSLKNYDSGKNKLILNTEALSALIKENESKKAEAMKAFETSSKLKSVDNAKYLEYQRKRTEKLATLKEKLRERKGKILQQYRQELLDALTKCDDEVERNLKRREIWDDFSNQEEFEDFVDKEKLAYLMMNRPVNYENIEEQDDEVIQGEDRRYYPEIDTTQPLRSPRERKIPNTENRRYFYDQPSTENVDTISNDNYSEDEPYYAIVESLENPKIYHKKQFDDEIFRKQDNRPVPKKYIDHQVKEKFHQPLKKYKKNNDHENYLIENHEEKPAGRIFAIDGSNYYGSDPVLHLQNEDLEPVSYRSDFPTRDENLLQKNYYRRVPSLQNTRYEKANDELLDNSVPEYHDGILYHRQYSKPIYSGENYFFDTQELDESQRFYGPAENEGQRLFRSERHLVPNEKQSLDEPAYKITQGNDNRDFSIRRERDTKEKQSNYICLKEDSEEDTGDDEKRIFKLVRKDDHYEAVPVSEITEESVIERQRKNHRRVARYNENGRNKRRKYETDAAADEEGNYYSRNSGYARRNLPKRENNDAEYQSRYKDDVEGKSISANDGVGYSLIGDEMNRQESGRRITPEEYELLMLIPVKKHKAKRQKRDLETNEIDRSGSFEDMNEVWGDIIDIKKNENRLKEYIDAKEKTLRDFEEAQANLNKYLKKLGSTQDPMQLEKFKKIILNLGSNDQEGMSVIAQSQDELDRIHLEEYLKKEILKKVEDLADEEREKSTTSKPENSTSSLFDVAMPKLENTINEELEKVGDLTESFEDFINEFDEKFNTTSEAKSDETVNQNPEKKKKISYNFFHNAINNVKKFFDFLSGVSLIFHRH